MQMHEMNIVHRSPNKKVDRGAIPVYNIHAAGNLHTLFANKSDYIVGEISIPKAPKCDGAIYVLENSMYPLIKGDDLAVYKQLHNINNLLEGEMYLVEYHIEGDDFLVIKYVKWEEKNSTLRLVSYNERYEDMIIPASALRAIGHVKIVITISSMI